ncbi:uncharacterized protein Dana_GF26616 [Drosophila ananassae]|uniref:Uncharacterized protein n=1 Tax=Drosophila ananassae TaxID=7217 RepID=A0A0P9BN20_DROAN|nr:uncharacterized protein Dana_GF26616 [Drosophila ananassae]
MVKELNCCLKFIKAWILLYCFANTAFGLIVLFIGDLIRSVIQFITEKIHVGPYIFGCLVLAMSIICVYGIIGDNSIAVSIFGLYFLVFLFLFIFRANHKYLETEDIVTICALLLGGSIPPFILACNL